MLHELKKIRYDTEHTEGWAESFGNQLGRALGREVKLARTQSVKSVRDEYAGLAETAERADCVPAGHCSREAGDEEA